MPAISRYLVVLPPARRPKSVGRTSLPFYIEKGATIWPLDGITADKARQLIKAGKLDPIYRKGVPVGDVPVPCEVAIKQALAVKVLGGAVFIRHTGRGKVPPGRYTLVAGGFAGETRLHTIHRCGDVGGLPTYSEEKFAPEEFGQGVVEVYGPGYGEGSVRFTAGSRDMRLVQSFPFGEPVATNDAKVSERALEYARGDRDFAAWLTEVDALCLRERMLSVFDLEDHTWRDDFDAGGDPEECFREFLLAQDIEVL